MNITAIILTYNEEQHLPRCISCLNDLVDQVIVVDSISTDATVKIAKDSGALVVKHAWKNYATQFNWALTQLDKDSDWILRIDADEYITLDLAKEIKDRLPSVEANIDGVIFNRRMMFQGKMIKYGGVFPVEVLRLFRHGRGECENRWMDEHIKVQGETIKFRGELIDDNKNSLTWWTEKHNHYASREAVDLLNLEYGFMPHDTVANLSNRSQVGVKRWFKEVVYARSPMSFRAFMYFIYRYFIRLGFLDGQAGMSFHFLQGFWYRYLVDAKIIEVKRVMSELDIDPMNAIERVLGIQVYNQSVQNIDEDEI